MRARELPLTDTLLTIHTSPPGTYLSPLWQLPTLACTTHATSWPSAEDMVCDFCTPVCQSEPWGKQLRKHTFPGLWHVLCPLL